MATTTPTTPTTPASGGGTGLTSDFLFSGTPPTSFTSTSYENKSLPDWWQAAAQGLIGKASSIASQPYPQYTGPRVAGWDPLQTQAYNNADSFMPQVNSELQGAQDLTNSGSQLFNQNDFNQFMNPYNKNVTDTIAQLGAQNLSENLLPAVNDTFTKAGQFGSSRNADFTNRAVRDTQNSILQQQSAALQSGFANSMNSYQTAQGNQLAGGKQLGALGALTQATGQAQNNQDYALGAAGQGQQQTNLNQAYSDFTNQTQYPQQMLSLLNNIIHGVGTNVQGSGTTTTNSTNPLPANNQGGPSPLSTIGNALSGFFGS